MVVPGAACADPWFPARTPVRSRQLLAGLLVVGAMGLAKVSSSESAQSGLESPGLHVVFALDHDAHAVVVAVLGAGQGRFPSPGLPAGSRPLPARPCQRPTAPSVCSSSGRPAPSRPPAQQTASDQKPIWRSRSIRPQPVARGVDEHRVGLEFVDFGSHHVGQLHQLGCGTCAVARRGWPGAAWSPTGHHRGAPRQRPAPWQSAGSPQPCGA